MFVDLWCCDILGEGAAEWRGWRGGGRDVGRRVEERGGERKMGWKRGGGENVVRVGEWVH